MVVGKNKWRWYENAFKIPPGWCIAFGSAELFEFRVFGRHAIGRSHGPSELRHADVRVVGFDDAFGRFPGVGGWCDIGSRRELAFPFGRELGIAVTVDQFDF